MRSPLSRIAPRGPARRQSDGPDRSGRAGPGEGPRELQRPRSNRSNRSTGQTGQICRPDGSKQPAAPEGLFRPKRSKRSSGQNSQSVFCKKAVKAVKAVKAAIAVKAVKAVKAIKAVKEAETAKRRGRAASPVKPTKTDREKHWSECFDQCYRSNRSNGRTDERNGTIPRWPGR